MISFEYPKKFLLKLNQISNPQKSFDHSYPCYLKSGVPPLPCPLGTQATKCYKSISLLVTVNLKNKDGRQT